MGPGVSRPGRPRIAGGLAALLPALGFGLASAAVRPGPVTSTTAATPAPSPPTGIFGSPPAAGRPAPMARTPGMSGPENSGQTAADEASRERIVERLLERIEAWSRAHPWFEARFEQRFVPRLFGRERLESGRLTVRRPGRMRWDYDTPEAKVFVSDGENTWFHLPADRQVVVGAFAPAGGEGDEAPPNPLHFLTGAARITDHFDAVLAASPTDEGTDEVTDEGVRTISLEPRRPGGGLAALRLSVESGSGRIRSLESEDLEGNRTEFRFQEFRFDREPDEARFTFRIPPGTEVVTASGASPSPTR